MVASSNDKLANKIENKLSHLLCILTSHTHSHCTSTYTLTLCIGKLVGKHALSLTFHIFTHNCTHACISFTSSHCTFTIANFRSTSPCAIANSHVKYTLQCHSTNINCILTHTFAQLSHMHFSFDIQPHDLVIFLT